MSNELSSHTLFPYLPYDLLRQTEPDLHSKSGRSATVRVGDQGLVNSPFVVQLYVQFLVYYVAYIWPELEVDVSICNDIQLLDLPLYGFSIAYCHV